MLWKEHKWNFHREWPCAEIYIHTFNSRKFFQHVFYSWSILLFMSQTRLMLTKHLAIRHRRTLLWQKPGDICHLSLASGIIGLAFFESPYWARLGMLFQENPVRLECMPSSSWLLWEASLTQRLVSPFLLRFLLLLLPGSFTALPALYRMIPNLPCGAEQMPVRPWSYSLAKELQHVLNVRHWETIVCKVH